MVLAIHTISDEHIIRASHDPWLVWKIVAKDDPGALEELKEAAALTATSPANEQPGRNNLFERIALTLKEGEGYGIDIDKSWHGIHYLLTGTAWGGEFPTSFLVGGGTEIGGIDDTFDSARAFTSDDVNRIAAVLDELTADTLRERFRPNEMQKMEIYPSIWDGHSEDNDLFEYCMEYFEETRKFLGDASSKKLGVFVYIC